ncbi:M15 family metallopeptidase [Psychroflexus sp. ALD_RP9]|uniref:M15 family metallopeptidase n=1 Tax=Psychroflexus sp. ALD_RP9 TaxID=2777186 RepID=UPI001A90A376|nr:M15 family metallopeptidase [Psychroflexus sp. ALD_RP9]QSS97564.1 M15 family metallopeptidase [Psychroflexus sp. ALD_RP9]
MKRSKFLQLTSFASAFIVNPLIWPQSTKVKIEQLMGLNQSHLNAQNTLENQTYIAYLSLKDAAKKAGIDLKIVSAYRSFQDQKRIFETKFKRNKSKGLSDAENIKNIINYSTIPGTSRHHWGTDFDIIDANVKKPKGDLLLEKHYHGNGVYCKLFEWMQENASKYGFKLVYTNNFHRKGFKYEPWHYSYQPVAKTFFSIQQSNEFRSKWNQLQFVGKSNITSKILNNYFNEHLRDINPSLK